MRRWLCVVRHRTLLRRPVPRLRRSRRTIGRGDTCRANCDSIKSNYRGRRSTAVADKAGYRIHPGRARQNDASSRPKKFMNGQAVLGSPPHSHLRPFRRFISGVLELTIVSLRVSRRIELNYSEDLSLSLSLFSAFPLY